MLISRNWEERKEGNFLVNEAAKIKLPKMVKLVLSYTFQPQKVMPEISQWRVELDLLVS